jgi:hypothetical protein
VRLLKLKWKTAILINLFLFALAAADARTDVNSAVNTGRCTLPDIPIDERPGPTDQPTHVTVGLRLLDVTAIEDTSQSITADFVISQTWTDPRLTAFEGCQFSLSEVWNPQIDIINAGRLFTRLTKQVDVHESGRVRYLQRYQGALVFRYDAHQFPFDRHDIVITLLSLQYGEKDVRIIIDEVFTGRKSDEFNVPDWKITQVQANITSEPIDAFKRNNSAYDFSISAKRRSAYYIWKIILPLILIVLMSWTVFWIDPAQFGPQIGMSATSMLTLIAFQFAMANILPHLSYYTLMDKFIVGSTIIVFLSLIESVTTSYLVSIQKKEAAMRIDRICRWTFPAVFVAFNLIVFSV